MRPLSIDLSRFAQPFTAPPPVSAPRGGGESLAAEQEGAGAAALDQANALVGAWMQFLDSNLPEPWQRALVILGVGVVLGWLGRVVLRGVLAQLTRRSETDLDDAFVRIAAGPLFVSGILAGVYWAGVELGLPPAAELLLARITKTLGLMLWVGAALRMCRPLLDSIGRLADRVQWLRSSTVPLIDNLARAALFVLVIYALLRIWDLDVAPWLASAGVAGLALGFAAKDSLANLFGGFFIIVDAPYRIGDYINLDAGERGEVTKIGLRSTRILTRDDVEVIIPNAQIAAAKIVNEAGGRWPKLRVRVPVGVAYGSDVAEVRSVLLAAAAAVDYAVTEPEARVRFRALGDSSLNFELLVWIEVPEQRGRAVDALLTEVYNRLNAADISIPFPQRTVHLVQPAQMQGDG